MCVSGREEGLAIELQIIVQQTQNICSGIGENNSIFISVESN